MKRLKRDLRGTRDASEVNERKGGVPGREILRRDRGATTRQKNDEKESCITRFGRQLRKFQFIPVSKGLVHPFKCHASATNAPNEKTGDFYAFGIRHAQPKRRSRLYCTTGNSVDMFVEYIFGRLIVELKMKEDEENVVCCTSIFVLLQKYPNRFYMICIVFLQIIIFNKYKLKVYLSRRSY